MHHSARATSLGFMECWGKAQPRSETGAQWHPVAFHLLDVAASAEAILAAHPVSLGQAARLIGLEPSVAQQLVVALIALHDLGKFTPAFQSKASPAGWTWPAALGPFDPTRVRGTRHTDDGFLLWSRLGESLTNHLWPAAGNLLSLLAPAIFGHHGRPCRGGGLDARPPEIVLGRQSVDAAAACANALVALLHPQPISHDAPDGRKVAVASWWLAGLTSVADWVGSRQEWFPYAAALDGDSGLRDYWPRARNQAAAAVEAAGLVAARAAALRSFGGLTGIETASPAQERAASIDLGDGQVLVVLEDVTGSGKTEAAQMLVHRLMTNRRANGAYWAMPTQATANAMYERQSKSIVRLFDSGQLPSLALTHAAARLHDAFRARVRESALPAIGDEPEARDIGPADADEPPSGSACAAFLADDRRAAMLADVGAGSVDQALLGVLPSRFNAIRLYGLADKVLVIDEAHAYDAYMRVEVNELLRFHAALGGSAIVLSATLSGTQRDSLVRSWSEGANGGRRSDKPATGRSSSAEASTTPYPLITVVTGSGATVREEPVDAAPWSRRRVPVRLIHESTHAIDHIVMAARRDAAVAWVRNTVDDALAAESQLRDRGIDPMMFHARFALVDRQAREAEVMKLFGKDSRAVERRGRVLIATQVIEQSLDLDFDVLVSDLAPIDLLIQRAGRLWRHDTDWRTRPTGVAMELVVLSPPNEAAPRHDWLTALLPGTARVYEDTGVLWRTVSVVSEARAIVTPHGLRELIERVYGTQDVPEALSQAAQTAHGNRQADAATANYQTLKVSDGYDGSARAWMDDLEAATRLADEQIVVRLARVGPSGRIEPWDRSDNPPWKRWALSEIRLRTTRVPKGAVADPRYEEPIDTLRADWKLHERTIPVLPLVSDDGTEWRGVLAHPTTAKSIEVTYSSTRGLAYHGRRA
jgi:CRISPR-associated endonuclease/helicase Cas3